MAIKILIKSLGIEEQAISFKKVKLRRYHGPPHSFTDGDKVFLRLSPI